MALLQISEPGMSTAPHEHRLAAGIDLGTTHSLVASVRNGVADILTDENHHRLIPSVVNFSTQGAIVGREALALAVSQPENTIASAKRMIGKGLDDLSHLEAFQAYDFDPQETGVPRLNTDFGKVTAIEVSAKILQTLRTIAESTLGDHLSGVVITVPAYFDDSQRQATRDAAKLAGLNVYRLLNEPTAAAIAYGLDNQATGTIAVYDLGGGTFDISILRLEEGVFEVLAAGGDSSLGGDDVDLLIAQWLLEQSNTPADAVNKSLWTELMFEARQAKEALSDSDEAALALTINGSQWNGLLARETFNEIIDPLLKRTLRSSHKTLRDAGLKVTDIDAIVMVGGSTRIPAIREGVEAFFSRSAHTDINPDEVVAIGAAIQADILAGNRPDESMLLLDVIPLSLGLETMGGLVERIIPRNTTIPTARAQQFTTFKDGQTAMSIHVLQGERELIDDNRSLAKFELRGFPPMVAGAARIEVTFQVDADGILTVEAEEQSSGTLASIDVVPSYGLSDSEIENMLVDSSTHAKEDVAQRMLREQQVEADRVIEALDSALGKDGDELLSPQEKQRIAASRSVLLKVAAEADPEAIKAAIKDVEAAAEGYVARRMNNSVKKAMAGHAVSDFDNA